MRQRRKFSLSGRGVPDCSDDPNVTCRPDSSPEPGVDISVFADVCAYAPGIAFAGWPLADKTPTACRLGTRDGSHRREVLVNFRARFKSRQGNVVNLPGARQLQIRRLWNKCRL